MWDRLSKWWWSDWYQFWRMLGGPTYVCTVAIIFGFGLLVGWLLFPERPAAPPLVLGSIADWVAAAGAVVAAISTIAIAVIGNNAIRARGADAERFAIAVIRSAVLADMEKAVRISRNWDKVTSAELIKHSRALQLHDFNDINSVSGLCSDVLFKFLAARSRLPFVIRAATSFEAKPDDLQLRRYLTSHVESFAEHLRDVADYVYRNSMVPVPWRDWRPAIDAGEFENAVLKFHSSPKTEDV